MDRAADHARRAAAALLRPGVLEGTSILVGWLAAEGTGEPGAPAARNVLEDCAALGARVHDCGLHALPDSAEELASHPALTEACEQLSAPASLVLDGATFFAGAGAGRAGLGACLELAWAYTRIVVAGALLPRGLGGRVIYLAPAPHAGPSADAARAGLENLARTLSIEWARHAVTTVAVAPGESTSAGELAALAAYLASPAGAYFSGCLLDLRG